MIIKQRQDVPDLQLDGPRSSHLPRSGPAVLDVSTINGQLDGCPETSASAISHMYTWPIRTY